MEDESSCTLTATEKENTMYKINCLCLSEKGIVLGDVVSIEISPDFKIFQLVRAIEKIRPNNLRYLDSNRPVLFKVDVPLANSGVQDLHRGLGDFDLFAPVAELRRKYSPSAEYLWEDSYVRTYWAEVPDREYLHVIVRVPEIKNLVAVAPPCRRSSAGFSGHISRREDTVKAIWDKLTQYRFITVRGPPETGKTILARLLQAYAEEVAPSANVVLADGSVIQGAGVHWMRYLKGLGWRIGSETIVIIDRAHQSYSNSDFWLGFIKNCEVYEGVKVVTFAKHGSVSSRVEFAPGASVAIISPLQTICLRPVYHNDGLPPVGLLCTKDEFDEVVRLKFWDVEPCHLDHTFLEGLFEITRGHVGATSELLQFIQSSQSYRDVQNLEGKLFTWDTFKTEFLAELRIERTWIRNQSILKRSIPLYGDEEEELCDALSVVVQRHVIRASEVDGDLNDKLRLCFRKGLLYSDFIGKIDDNSAIGFYFACPIVQWFAEWTLFWNKPLENDLGDDLMKYVLDVIRRFNPKTLSTKRSIGPGFYQRPPGVHYQDEFYRCCHAISPGSLVSFPEFGTGSSRVDFYVPSKKWGVEVLCEGDGLAEHVGRFSSTSAHSYAPHDDHVILDFRTTVPQVSHPDLHKLYHIVFENDYEKVRVLGSMIEVIEGGEFTLGE